MARLIFCLTVCLLLSDTASGQEVVASVSQGTNMALALSPDRRTLVVDLMGQLWSLPVEGGGAQPLLPADESARNPRFSPDGSHLVYQQYSRGQWDVWLLELATATRRRLTGPPTNEREPEFSADSRAVVFVSDRDGPDALFRMMLTTGAVTRLPSAGRASWPSVSERGEVAYIEQRGTEWALRLLPFYGPPLTLYTSSNELRAPSWRPGGGVIIFSEQRDPQRNDLRMIVLSDEPVIKTLTSGEDIFGFRAAWSSPADFFYTADGRIWKRTLGNTTRRAVPLFAGVAVNRSPQGLKTSVAPGPDPHEVQGIRAPRASPAGGSAAFTALGDLWLQGEHGDLRQLTDDAYLDIDPAFGPDTNRLIFASDRAGTMDLWSLDIDSGRLAQLTFGPEKSFAPAVSSDGKRVAYLATMGFGPWARSELRVLELDTPRQAQTLARDLFDAGDVAWDPTGATISLWARDPEPGGDSERRARYEIDLERRAAHWDTEPTQPGRELLAPRDGPVLTWAPPAEGGRFVIQVDRLFDGVGTQYRRHVDIHIDGRRISAVTARDLLPRPETVIDRRGYTAMPGLIDLHAHQSAIAGERLGRIWLAYGVTTVREVASVRDDGLERKEAWASGRRLGPRLLLSARHGTTTGWPTPADAVRPAYDVAEIYRGQPLQLSRGVLEDARRFGIPVFSEDLFPAVRFGINGLEHIGGRPMTPYDLERSSLSRSYADVVDTLVLSGTAVTPMLAAFGGYAWLAAQRPLWAEEPAYRQLYTRGERAAWQASSQGRDLEGLQSTVAMLVRSGARVTAGSDAPSVPYGLGLHAELSLLSRAGVPPDQALRLVTAEAALALGLERDLGTIEPGKLADLVILDGNPLMNISDTLNIVAVVRDGVWYDRDSLLRADSPPQPDPVE